MVNGVAATGYKLFTYTAGTTTKQTTYTTSTGNIANPNPIILNSAGYSPNEIWLTSGVSYKFVLAPSNDTDPPVSPIWTRDNISAINDASSLSTPNEWVSGPTPTYISGTSFSLAGDQTSTFQVGRRVKTTNSGGTIYSTILTSVFSSLTTLTLTNDSGSLDSGLSAVSYGLLAATGLSYSSPVYLDSTLLSPTLREKLLQTGIISANADGGCIGDDSTDNQAALYLLRDFMRLNPRPWTLNFNPNSGTGVYRFSKNQWIKGITNLTINAEGCTFKCTSASATTFDKIPFTGNQGVFNNSGYTTYNSASTLFGYLVNSGNPGDATITTTTASDAGNFAAGNKVLIYGYGQQDASFPPNPRYFEWNEVVSAVAGTGVVTLKNPLKNTYNSAWHDFATGKGAPRIQNLSRSASDFTFGKSLVVNGGYWAPNTTDPTAKSFQCEGYERIVLNGVKADDFVPTQAKSFELNNCDFASAEFDKIISSIKVRGGRIATLTNGTGVELVTLTDGALIQGASGLECKNLIVDGAILDTQGVSAGTAVWGINSGYPLIMADFRSAEFKVKDATSTALINGGVETTFLTSSAPSNTKVLVSCANAAAFEAVYQTLHEGFTYQLQDGTKRVRITKIYDNDASHAAIEGEFTLAPAGAETYRGALCQNIRMGNISQTGPYAPVMACKFPRQQYYDLEFRNRNVQRLTFSSIDIPRDASAAAASAQNIIIRGYIVRVFVLITKVYSGADGSDVLVVKQTLPSSKNYASVNIKTAGARECTPFTTSGAVAGDTLTATSADYVDTMQLYVGSGGGFYPTYTGPTQLPNWIIQVDVMKDPS